MLVLAVLATHDFGFTFLHRVNQNPGLGGFNPFEKYATVKLIPISPGSDRGENSKNIEETTTQYYDMIKRK